MIHLDEDLMQTYPNNSFSIKNKSLPPTLKPFFQEYDLTNLDLDHSKNTIIERVLQYGNRSEIRWLFRVYSFTQVTHWVKQWGKYALPEPHLTFWKLVLHITEQSS